MKSNKINGQGIASLILGTVGMMFSCIFIGAIFSFIGLFVGIKGLNQNDSEKGTSLAGIICSLFSIFLSMCMLIVVFVLFDDNTKLSTNEDVNVGIMSEIESDDITINEEPIKSDLEQSVNDNYVKTISEIGEDDFKSNCVEITYNDLDEEWIGKYVTKEIIFGDLEVENNVCVATEDLIEELDGYQHSYRIYKINDVRLDKSFPINENDVIRVYGIIKDVNKNYANGLFYPVIDMYYVEYKRKWGDIVDETKDINEIIEEREKEKIRLKEEEKYYNSLNSDYSGTSKNVDAMDELSLGEYINCCDKLNYNDLYSGEDFTGRYVAIHVQLFSHKIFTSEKGKENRLGDWTDIQFVQNDVWEITVYNEKAEDYIADFGTIYFLNKEDISPNNLKKGDKLIIYGQLINHPKETYDDWEVLVRYYEIE